MTHRLSRGNHRNLAAFTLVELLVTVTIIAILVTITMSGWRATGVLPPEPIVRATSASYRLR
ncbi:prepilin-type N-terminal cleavage/methylation domain-containing protein [Verrucomicrobium spinosum]|uniref:type II secretion system protein n=1 Tax=Verrucomicrobium spinosum TaxID=2736 RepID=UPI0009463C15